MARYANLDEVIASYSERFQPNKAADVEAIVHMDLSGDNSRSIVLIVNKGELSISEDAVPDDPTLTLKADADNWLAVENGELNPMMAMMQGKLKLKGNPAFAMKFMSLFGYSG